jgi:hypothetical protein
MKTKTAVYQFFKERLIPLAVFNLNVPTVYPNGDYYPTGYELRNIFPEFTKLSDDPKYYDMLRAKYWTEDKLGFKAVMDFMYAHYIGYAVFLVADYNQWQYDSIESLVKFIQDRYGYQINLINEPEDLECVQESGYTIIGRQNLQADKEKYCYEFIDVAENDEG